MGWSWQTALALALAIGVGSNPLRPRQLPWPEPVPASSIGALDWSSIHPPLYNPNPNSKSHYSLKTTTTTPLPSSVDWRDRSGMNYITTPQNQGACNSCWAFAVAALIEAMVRIEHGVWSKRSEADVHDGLGAACESTGNAEETLAWVAGQGPSFVNNTGPDDAVPPPGIADWPCDPYQDTLHPYEHCADRSGRTTRIPFYQALGVVEDQKRWLDAYGPLVATFVLYADFAGWKPTAENQGVYKWDGVSESTGNHLALVVGYDDARQAWIMKNSWGTGWGEGGFVYFAYVSMNKLLVGTNRLV
jgi:C1A family cysteine protease